MLEIPIHPITPIHGAPLPSIHPHAVMRRIHDLHQQRFAGNPHQKRTRISRQGSSSHDATNPSTDLIQMKAGERRSPGGYFVRRAPSLRGDPATPPTFPTHKATHTATRQTSALTRLALAGGRVARYRNQHQCSQMNPADSAAALCYGPRLPTYTTPEGSFISTFGHQKQPYHEIGISRWYISFTTEVTLPNARSNTLCAGRFDCGTNLESSSNSNLVSFKSVNTRFRSSSSNKFAMPDVTNPVSELSSPATNTTIPQGPRHRHPSDRTAPRPALTDARVGAIPQTTANLLNHPRQTRPLRVASRPRLPQSYHTPPRLNRRSPRASKVWHAG